VGVSSPSGDSLPLAAAGFFAQAKKKASFE